MRAKIDAGMRLFQYRLRKGEIVMFKKIPAFILAGVLIASLAACGSSNSNTENSSNSASQLNGETITANDDGEKSKAPAEGKVNKYKIYELKRADNDQITIELWYRDGSEYVAQVSGVIYVPTGSTEYESMLADNIAFDEKVKATSLSDDIMHFSYDEVKLDNGYVRCDFAFKELDADNSDSVAMIAEFLELPVSNGYFKLAECEEYLLQRDIPLTDEH